MLGGSYMFADASIGPADADASVDYCPIKCPARAARLCHDLHITALARAYAGRLARRLPPELEP